MSAATHATLGRLVGLQVRIPADVFAICGVVRDAKVSYNRVRIQVEATAPAGGTAKAWVEADRCTFATPNGLVPGHKILGGAA